MITKNLYKKGQQRLYSLRKLNALQIDKNILFVFHDSFVNRRLVSFADGVMSQSKTEKINRIYIISCNIAGCCTTDTSLEQLYKSRTLQMATKILSDRSHFLHDHNDILPSGRRYMPIIKTSVPSNHPFHPPSI